MNATLETALAGNTINYRCKVVVKTVAGDTIIKRWATEYVAAGGGVSEHSSVIHWGSYSKGQDKTGGLEETGTLSLPVELSEYNSIVGTYKESEVYFEVYISDPTLSGIDWTDAGVSNWEKLGKFFYTDGGYSGAIGTLILQTERPTQGLIVGTRIDAIYADADTNADKIIPISYGDFNTSITSDTLSYFYRFKLSATGSGFTPTETVSQAVLGSPSATVTGYDIADSDYYVWVTSPVNEAFFQTGQLLTGVTSAYSATLEEIDYIGYPTVNVSPDVPTSPKLAKSVFIGDDRTVNNNAEIVGIDGVYVYSGTSSNFYRTSARANVGECSYTNMGTAETWSYFQFKSRSEPPSPWYFVLNESGNTEIVKAYIKNKPYSDTYLMYVTERGCFGTDISDHTSTGFDFETYSLQYYHFNTDNAGNSVVKSIPTSVSEFDLDTVAGSIGVVNPGLAVDGDDDTKASFTYSGTNLQNRISFNVDVLDSGEGFNPPVSGDEMFINTLPQESGFDGKFLVDDAIEVTPQNYQVIGRITQSGLTLISGRYLFLEKTGPDNDVSLQLTEDSTEVEPGGYLRVYKNSTDLVQQNPQSIIAEVDMEVDLWGEGNITDGGEAGAPATTVFDYRPDTTDTAGGWTNANNGRDGNLGTNANVQLTTSPNSGSMQYSYSTGQLPVWRTGGPTLRIAATVTRNSNIVTYTDADYSIISSVTGDPDVTTQPGLTGDVEQSAPIQTNWNAKAQSNAQNVTNPGNILTQNGSDATFSPGATEAHIDLSFYDVSTQPTYPEFNSVYLNVYAGVNITDGGLTNDTKPNTQEQNDFSDDVEGTPTNVTNGTNFKGTNEGTFASWDANVNNTGDITLGWDGLTSGVTIPEGYTRVEIVTILDDDSASNNAFVDAYKNGNFLIEVRNGGSSTVAQSPTIKLNASKTYTELVFDITEFVKEDSKVGGDTWAPQIRFNLDNNSGSYTDTLRLRTCKLRFFYIEIDNNTTVDNETVEIQLRVDGTTDTYIGMEIPADGVQAWRTFEITDAMMQAGNTPTTSSNGDNYRLIASSRGDGGTVDMVVDGVNLSFVRRDVDNGTLDVSNVTVGKGTLDVDSTASVSTPGDVEIGLSGITVLAQFYDGTSWLDAGEIVIATVTSQTVYKDISLVGIWNPVQEETLTDKIIALSAVKEANNDSDYTIKVHDCYIEVTRDNLIPTGWLDFRFGVNNSELVEIPNVRMNLTHKKYYVDITELVFNQFTRWNFARTTYQDLEFKVDLGGNGPIAGTIVNIYGVDVQVVATNEIGGDRNIYLSGQMTADDTGGSYTGSSGAVVEKFGDVIYHFLAEVCGFAAADWVDITSFTGLRSGDTKKAAFQLLEKSDADQLINRLSWCRNTRIFMDTDNKYSIEDMNTPSGLTLTDADIDEIGDAIGIPLDYSQVYYSFRMEYNTNPANGETQEVTTTSTADVDYQIYSEYDPGFILPTNDTATATTINNEKESVLGTANRNYRVTCSFLGFDADPGQTLTLPTIGSVVLKRSETEGSGNLPPGFTTMMLLEVEKT